MPSRWRTTTLVSPPTHVFSGHTTDLARSIWVPRSRNLYRYLLLQLSRFDDACRFRIRLARTSLYSELDKWCSCHHACKFVQKSTLQSEFLQRSSKQGIEVQTRRVRRAVTANISLWTDRQTVAGKGNGRVSARVGEVTYATVDRLLGFISILWCPNQTLIFCGGQDHVLINV